MSDGIEKGMADFRKLGQFLEFLKLFILMDRLGKLGNLLQVGVAL